MAIPVAFCHTPSDRWRWTVVPCWRLPALLWVEQAARLASEHDGGDAVLLMLLHVDLAPVAARADQPCGDRHTPELELDAGQDSSANPSTSVAGTVKINPSWTTRPCKSCV